MKAEVFDHTWLSMDLPFLCEIHACMPREFVTPNAKKVLAIFSEPRPGMVSNDWVKANHALYDLILTYDRALEHLPNVRILYFGGAHCDERPTKKEFSYSFLLSTGANVSHYQGYEKRRFIAENFGIPTIPGRLFLSSRRLALAEEALATIQGNAGLRNYSVAPIGPSKLAAMESMFHLAIENNIDDCYFSEKLLDCFRTYTVPIYWGTSRIAEIFDMKGVIVLKDADTFNCILESLTAEDYWDRMPAMIRNFELASKYIDFVGNARSLILQALS